MFAYTVNNDNFGRRQVNDGLVAGSMYVLRINANYLTSTLCCLKDVAQVSVLQRHILVKK